MGTPSPQVGEGQSRDPGDGDEEGLSGGGWVRVGGGQEIWLESRGGAYGCGSWLAPWAPRARTPGAGREKRLRGLFSPCEWS